MLVKPSYTLDVPVPPTTASGRAVMLALALVVRFQS